jgi:flagellar basal-body rod modification protein FlgD
MTTTNTTTPTSSSTPSSSSSAAAIAGTQQIAGNFNTFLQLLTTQLQNQDPLSPLDTDQFTQQLVEFASVQQEVDTNQNMQTLIALQQTSQATSALQLVGSTVTVSGTTASLASGSPATWSLNSPSPATGTVTITNSSGITAYTGTVSLTGGTQTYSWNGQGSNGVTWPAGQYTMAISATSASGQSVSVTSQVQGTVSGVNLSSSPAQVIVNGQDYPISSIQSISSGGSSALSTLNTSIGNLNTSIGNLSQLL